MRKSLSCMSLRSGVRTSTSGLALTLASFSRASRLLCSSCMICSSGPSSSVKDSRSSAMHSTSPTAMTFAARGSARSRARWGRGRETRVSVGQKSGVCVWGRRHGRTSPKWSPDLRVMISVSAPLSVFVTRHWPSLRM